MKYLLTIFCLAFCLSVGAEEIKINASKEELKKMAEIDKARAEKALAEIEKATKLAEAKKAKADKKARR